jgi:hypothetical protein
MFPVLKLVHPAWSVARASAALPEESILSEEFSMLDLEVEATR